MLPVLKTLNTQVVLVSALVILVGYFISKKGKSPFFTMLVAIVTGLIFCLVLNFFALVTDYSLFAWAAIFGLYIFPLRKALEA